MAEIISKTVKAGGRTYFFDVKEAKNGKPYLTISESRFSKEGQEPVRNRIFVFPETAEEFGKVYTQTAKLLKS